MKVALSSLQFTIFTVQRNAPDGKNALHTTAIVISQRKYPENSVTTPLILDDYSKPVIKCLKDLPDSMTELLPCKMPIIPKPSS